jgi:hypothetical protein
MEAALVCSVLAVGVLAAGCNDPNKARLAMLENQNAQLASEQGQLMSDLQRARDAAAQARREAEMFRAQRAATPEPPAEWKGVSGGAMTSIPGSLLFDSGKATLIAGAREKLDKIADTILSEFANKDVYVFGHTDAQPIQHSKWRDNRHLSSERRRRLPPDPGHQSRALHRRRGGPVSTGRRGGQRPAESPRRNLRRQRFDDGPSLGRPLS